MGENIENESNDDGGICVLASRREICGLFKSARPSMRKNFCYVLQSVRGKCLGERKFEEPGMFKDPIGGEHYFLAPPER